MPQYDSICFVFLWFFKPNGASFCTTCPLSPFLRLNSESLSMADTLPETNMTPENGWLEYYFPIGEAYFQGQAVSFREGTLLAKFLKAIASSPGTLIAMSIFTIVTFATMGSDRSWETETNHGEETSTICNPGCCIKK